MCFVFHSQSPFKVAYRAGSVVMNFFFISSLCEKVFISPSIPNDSFVGYNIFTCRFFSFQHFEYSCHSCLAFKILAVKSADSHIGFPFYVTFFFSLTTFKILSLSLFFFGFLKYYLSWCGPSCVEFESLCFLNLDLYFPPQIQEVLAIIYLNNIFCPLYSLFSF